MIDLKRKTIRWNRLILPCVLLAILAGTAAVKRIQSGNVMQAGAGKPEIAKTYFEPEIPSSGSLEELYQDVFMTMLLSYIQEAVSHYYEENTGYSPNVDPWQPDILSILSDVSVRCGICHCYCLSESVVPKAHKKLLFAGSAMFCRAT